MRSGGAEGERDGAGGRRRRTPARLAAGGDSARAASEALPDRRCEPQKRHPHPLVEKGYHEVEANPDFRVTSRRRRG
jgi:hypothetical protein